MFFKPYLTSIGHQCKTITILHAKQLLELCHQRPHNVGIQMAINRFSGQLTINRSSCHLLTHLLRLTPTCSEPYSTCVTSTSQPILSCHMLGCLGWPSSTSQEEKLSSLTTACTVRLLILRSIDCCTLNSMYEFQKGTDLP